MSEGTGHGRQRRAARTAASPHRQHIAAHIGAHTRPPRPCSRRCDRAHWKSLKPEREEVDPVARRRRGNRVLRVWAVNLLAICPPAAHTGPASGKRPRKWTRLPALWWGSRVLRVTGEVRSRPRSRDPRAVATGRRPRTPKQRRPRSKATVRAPRAGGRTPTSVPAHACA